MLHTRAVAKKGTPRFGPRSTRNGASVPYGPPQTGAVAAPGSASRGAGRTAVKVGLALAAPFLARALFRAITR